MKQKKNIAKAGYIVWGMLAVITLITFAIAILTPPLSGPWCRGNCIDYPYLDIISRYPRDYYWMFGAIVLYLIYIPGLVVIHLSAGRKNKLVSFSALLFGFGGSLILLMDYFLQLAVIQPSLLMNEYDGISLLTQYNPHGIFIVLEEAGYFLITIAFLFQAFLYKGKGLKMAIRIVFLSGFGLSVISFLLLTLKFGLLREYFYEVAAISVVWLVFIANGAMLALYFRKKLKKLKQKEALGGS